MKTRACLLLPVLFILLAACGDDEGTKPGVDTVAPGRVQDLTAESPTPNEVTLTWTAPGDDGAAGRASFYLIRYSTTAIAPDSWNSAEELERPPTPRPAGEPESLRVEAAGARNWYFTLRAADETYNWSPLSNVASARLGDGGPPDFVADLAVTAMSLHGVTLEWSASGDDGRDGTAAEYDLRVAQSPITRETWGAATRVPLPAPAPAGTRESATVEGLSLTRSYYFALRVGDEFAQWSPLSNVVSGVPGLRRLTESPASSRFGARHAAWSPDGETIAFSADWNVPEDLDIFTIPTGGGAARRLTTNPDLDDDPEWVSNTTSIAYTSRRGGKDEIWQLDSASGADVRRLAAGESDVFQPSWTRFGPLFAYAVCTSPTTSAIYADSLPGGFPRLVFGDASQNTEPAWCPVDTRPDTFFIAFTSDRSGGPSLWYALSVGGGAVHLSLTDASEGSPSWSPTGTRIAFRSDRSGNDDIWIMPLGSGTYQQITFDPASDTDPAWSPDSTEIAFTSRRSGKPEIWIQRLE